MKVSIKSEQELIDIAQDAIKIIVNLRYATKLWEEQHGYEPKNKKKNWERIADDFIAKLQAHELTQNEKIKIEIE